jgi:ATP phosphoribosyltransferase regulatory subunit
MAPITSKGREAEMLAMLAEAGIETPDALEELLDGPTGDAAELSAFDPTAELVALFQREVEAEMVEPAILLPADLFLDTAGEDIRRRLFLTSDAEGRELCLRPDFTIPICRHYLETGAAGREAALGYFGPVFRQRSGESAEFLQAGIELFGNEDRAAADADVLALAHEAANLFAVDAPQVKIGDEGVFLALLDGLGLAPPLRRRLRGLFGTPERLTATIRRLSAGGGDEAVRHAGILGALAGSKPEEAQALIEDLLGLAGIATVGGRSAHEIAERFLERAGLSSHGGLTPETGAILTRYLAITCSPEHAVEALDAFQADVGIDMGAAIDLFARRNDAFRDCGIDLDRPVFRADFGRNLDYYTGFVFEMRDPDRATDEGGDKPVIGGGRYDGLIARLGSPKPVAACGFSMWLDRLGIAGYGQELGEGP